MGKKKSLRTEKKKEASSPCTNPKNFIGDWGGKCGDTSFRKSKGVIKEKRGRGIKKKKGGLASGKQHRNTDTKWRV